MVDDRILEHGWRQNLEQDISTEQKIRESIEESIQSSIEDHIEDSIERKIEKLGSFRQKARSVFGANEILPVLHYDFLSEITNQLGRQMKDSLDKKQAEGAFFLWNKDALALKKLVGYIEAVTTEGGEDFIPVMGRVAVFDLDGTLFCETDPTYFDYVLLHYRVCEDPDYKDRASDFEREVAAKIEESIRTGIPSSGLDVENGKAISSAFAGLSVEEFGEYIRKVRQMPAKGYSGMTIGEAFYKPMIQVISYLKAHSFRVFICSGTDRMVVRGIVDGEVDVMPSEVMGTDEVLVAQDQGDLDAMNYAFENKDKLVLGGKLLVKNLKMNKVSVIAREIGQQPVLCFGNSPGDSSMAHYVTTGNPYRTAVFMVCCDDLERENGNLEKAQKMYDMCEENGWTPISMKNDWMTIYGPGVMKKRQVSEG